jgi:hypothetical protein
MRQMETEPELNGIRTPLSQQQGVLHCKIASATPFQLSLSGRQEICYLIFAQI